MLTKLMSREGWEMTRYPLKAQSVHDGEFIFYSNQVKLNIFFMAHLILTLQYISVQRNSCLKPLLHIILIFLLHSELPQENSWNKRQWNSVENVADIRTYIHTYKYITAAHTFIYMHTPTSSLSMGFCLDQKWTGLTQAVVETAVNPAASWVWLQQAPRR